jgi:hypothetical protein
MMDDGDIQRQSDLALIPPSMDNQDYLKWHVAA